MALTCPGWLEWLSQPALAGVDSEPFNVALLRDAPLARYWVAANAPGTSCLTCHAAGDSVSGDRHVHANGIVKCLLCARGCVIREGERGGCRARMNLNGELRTLVYGRPITVHIDPIEKKPFYHFLPGSAAFSLATAGCPLHCKFCQNWEISQARPEDYAGPYTPPDTIVAKAARPDVQVIAFTYNEPTVFTEYLTDIARLARPHGIPCVLVSCGFMNEAPLTEMCSVLRAIKIDLKGFSPEFYQRVCSAELAPVLRSIKQVARSGVHLEIVNLVVPSLNDSETMMTDLVKWVMGELGPDVPVHFTRFHPDYQMLNLPPTPVGTLERAYAIAREAGMHYPYVGNVPGHPGDNTYCPQCGRAVIERSGFFISAMNIGDGRCRYCREPIAGVWSLSHD
ncbi:MAG: AmmeMemoRadiSam system radical SAM enzyme [Candidatus Zixiibacteriota bacterium]